MNLSLQLLLNQIVANEEQLDPTNLPAKTIFSLFASNPSVECCSSHVDLTVCSGDWNAVFRCDKIYMAMYKSISRTHLITLALCDSIQREMVVLTAETLDCPFVDYDLSGLISESILDINSQGRRWEGPVLNNKPFGYGREYSERNNLVYEGFVFDSLRVCYGKEYADHSSACQLLYDGCYLLGERYGDGIAYNLKGGVEYKGKRHATDKNNNKNKLIIPISTKEFTVGTKEFNMKTDTTLHFSPLLSSLERISIGSESFENIHEFVLDGLISLQDVRIVGRGVQHFFTPSTDGGIFRIKNCPKLLKLYIGYNIFKDFNIFEVSNVQSLRSLVISGYCFYCVREFILDGLDNLKKVSIGNYCFYTSDSERNDGICRIANCPKLRKIDIGVQTFADYKFFEIFNLNALRTLYFGGESNFGYAEEFKLKGGFLTMVL